jgi:plasmid stability protein
MGKVLMRNLDDEVINSLRYKAKAKGRSLEQELREILTNAAPFTVEERVKVAEWLQSTMKLDVKDFKADIRAGRNDEFFEE